MRRIEGSDHHTMMATELLNQRERPQPDQPVPMATSNQEFRPKLIPPISSERDNMLGHSSFRAMITPCPVSADLAVFAVNLALDGLDANSQCSWHRQIAALGMTRAC